MGRFKKSAFHNNRKSRTQNRASPLHQMETSNDGQVLLLRDAEVGLYAVYSYDNSQLHYCNSYSHALELFEHIINNKNNV